MVDMNRVVGSCNILFITLDTLRYDVACRELESGGTPNLAHYIPNKQWEKRHSPGSFTYASHSAFFAGFLPTPASPGPHSRLFAAKFAGSESTASSTFTFDTPDLVSGLANVGYKTSCIGGVGFFNKSNELSKVFPRLFQESYWERSYGVTDPESTKYQVEKAVEIITRNRETGDKSFLFMNISAMHQPNCHYISGHEQDSVETHAAALRYVDSQLPPLFEALEKGDDTFVILCSDHGTLYGEEGHIGHRYAHENIWNVPFTSFLLKGDTGE